MEKISFSKNVKDHLRNVPIKKKCCNHAFADGCCVFTGDVSPADMIKKGVSQLVCADCTSHFTAGLFISAGNISDPAKNYHMEFSMPDSDSADAAEQFLTSAGFEPKRTLRKNRVILYYKNSAVIEDLLGYMGAAFGAFEIMNAKIVKELRSDTNRQVNCDSANIAKSVGAAERLLSIIDTLKSTGSFEMMSDDLKAAADLRTEFPNATMLELGAKFSPPISKSGVKHRLDKIVEFYELQMLKTNGSET